MNTSAACEALNKKLILQVRYDGYFRNVEVHAVGYTQDGNAVMRVWQVSGGSESGERTGWKLLRLDEASSFGLSEDSSSAPRKGYRRGDKAMSRIVCQL